MSWRSGKGNLAASARPPKLNLLLSIISDFTILWGAVCCISGIKQNVSKHIHVWAPAGGARVGGRHPPWKMK